MNNRGFALIEALLAVGLAAILLSGALGMVTLSNRSSADALLRQDALWAAQEGLDALSSIAFADLITTETGSLSFAANEWALVGTGPDTIQPGMTRTTRVQTVQRDGSCNVGGGAVDPDTYTLVSEVSWTDLAGNTQTQTLSTLRTNWSSPTGSCFGPELGCVSINTASAEWFGGKQLREVYLASTCEDEVEVDKVTFWWNNAAEIQQVFIDDDKFWSQSGPGTPSGTQTSGTELDGEDEDIDDEESVEMRKVQFTSNMEGTTLTLKIEFDDGSSVTTDPFTPL